ncbi:hypothetical protein CIK64_13680 [Brevibacterium aurantiacum]|uniref:N-hydroxyarylamine O-acetyltransferase n=1 Tax=Brevibacterium aurantiacum TaxID=273384 RepID=A0A2A3Z2Q1_BREAU|nr:hypothetical protein CIK64_13680 [Brevibacterium aurantiacum]
MTHVSLLSRYADRLGLSDSAPELHRRAQGSCAQIVELLDEILVAHTHSICFENLDVVAFRAKGDLEAVAIDVDGAAGKLLTDGRGGYCHEHASLIRGVVTELGLRAHPILARVHLGDGQTAPGALTHQATIVDLDGRRLLIDPGFGGGTPEAALELSESAAARMTSHGEHRIVPARTALTPHLRADSDWCSNHEREMNRTFAPSMRSAKSLARRPISTWRTGSPRLNPGRGSPVRPFSLCRSLTAAGSLWRGADCGA